MNADAMNADAMNADAMNADAMNAGLPDPGDPAILGTATILTSFVMHAEYNTGMGILMIQSRGVQDV